LCCSVWLRYINTWLAPLHFKKIRLSLLMRRAVLCTAVTDDAVHMHACMRTVVTSEQGSACRFSCNVACTLSRFRCEPIISCYVFAAAGRSVVGGQASGRGRDRTLARGDGGGGRLGPSQHTGRAAVARCGRR